MIRNKRHYKKTNPLQKEDWIIKMKQGTNEDYYLTEKLSKLITKLKNKKVSIIEILKYKIKLCGVFAILFLIVYVISLFL